MSGWNQAPMPRDELLLFRQTLGERIGQDHSVRLFAEILDGLNWQAWERHYVLVAGQPPIHPRIMAGLILYGLSHGLRSSRKLEWACGNAVDFMWLRVVCGLWSCIDLSDEAFEGSDGVSRSA